MEQQQKLVIESLKSAAEENEKKTYKLETDNERLTEEHERIKLENDKLKQILEEKLSLIHELQNDNCKPLAHIKNPPIIKSQTINGNNNTGGMAKMASTDVQEDSEENSSLKDKCNRIIKKMSMKNTGQRKTMYPLKGSNPMKIVNTTACTCENKPLDKENIEINSKKSNKATFKSIEDQRSRSSSHSNIKI